MTTAASPRVSLPVSLEGKSDCITSLLQNLRWLTIALALSALAVLTHFWFLQGDQPSPVSQSCMQHPICLMNAFCSVFAHQYCVFFWFQHRHHWAKSLSSMLPKYSGVSDYRHITLLCLCFHLSPSGFLNLGTIDF